MSVEMTNLGDYKIFYYVAKNGNITRTAQRLYMTQPALTKAIQRLEHELGQKLFSRSQKGVELTPEGRHLFQMIAPPIEELIAIERRIMNESAQEVGKVRLNANYHFANVYMPDILVGFKEEYPNITVDIECRAMALKEMQESIGEYDIFVGFGRKTDEDVKKAYRLSERTLRRMKDVMFVGEPLFHLADRVMSLEEVADYALIASGTDKWIKTAYGELFERYGKQLKMLSAGGTDLRLALVRQGEGILVTSEGNGEETEREGIIRRLNIREELPARELKIYTRPHDEMSVAARMLEDYITDWFEENHNIG